MSGNEKNQISPVPAASMDLVEHNLEELKKLFPNVFTEGRIDFKALEAELGEHIETANERYQFTWAGKDQAKRIATTPSLGTLRPAPDESVNWEETENLYIEGDNLEVLKLLQKSYFNQVKMIYIDPPYNTGKDFVYKDDFKDNLANYQRLTGQRDEEGNPLFTNSDSAGRYHSNWLNMMYPRLKLARNLLRDDGVIFISIDDHEVHNLRKVCDEIFGESNLIATLIWDTNHSAQSGIFKVYHQYVYVYARNKSQIFAPQIGDGEQFEAGAQKRPSSRHTVSEFTFPAGTKWKASDGSELTGEWGGIERTALKQGRMIARDGVLIEPVTLEAAWTQKGQMQQYFYGEKDTLSDSRGQKIEEFYFSPSGKIKIIKARGVITPSTVRREYGSQNTTSTALAELFEKDASPLDSPKPISMIQEFASWFTGDDDIVLDFFSGSSTTAHAVMQLNAEDDGNRKFIMVQIPEPSLEGSDARKAGYVTIAEIGKERIRRAAKKVQEEHPEAEVNFGFKVLKLDTSNIKKWQPDFDSLEASLLDAVDNILPNRTSHDLLYEVLIKYGLPLTLPVDQIQAGDHIVYNVASGSLVACFDEGVTLETVQAIIKLSTDEAPILRVVFCDTSFIDDIVKTNAIQRFKQAGIDDVLSI